MLCAMQVGRSLAAGAVAALLLTIGGSHAAGEQGPPDTLRVATRLVAPFALEEHGQLTGFSIDLWQAISEQLHVKSEFVVKPSLPELLRSVRSGEAALAISAISITAERDRDFDFSQPMFDAGLQILVPAEESRARIARTILASMFSSAVLPIVGFVFLTIVAIAHVVWLFERRRPGVVSSAYYPGIFEACWWAAATLATQADQMPRTAMARVVSVLWMFASVVFIAYFTAAMTSSLTLRELHGDINGPQDLPGKRVVTVQGSTSAEYLREHDIIPYEVPDPDSLFERLQQGEAQAVVYDAPVVMYYASHDGRGKVALAGSIFRRENYGILFPSNSKLRKRVDEALLEIKENGVYDQLYRKWFGSESRK
jgi:polar amino acid transport system substrate-binding protein